MFSTALIHGDYRYSLTRKWDYGHVLVFIGLNPSIAGIEIDDPTLRKNMHYARREGFSGVVLLNIAALRSTQPELLLTHPDPVGPLNAHILGNTIKDIAAEGGKIIAAWGSHRWLTRDAAQRSIEVVRGCGVPLLCLHKNQDGNPAHPLYQRNNRPFETWP